MSRSSSTGGASLPRRTRTAWSVSATGDIRLSWRPAPRIEVRGEHEPGRAHIEALLNIGADTKIWHTRLQVHLLDSAGVPTPPTEEAPPRSRVRRTGYLGPTEIYPPGIGDGTVLAKVTGLIANDWDGYGIRVAEPPLTGGRPGSAGLAPVAAAGRSQPRP